MRGAITAQRIFRVAASFPGTIKAEDPRVRLPILHFVVDFVL